MYKKEWPSKEELIELYVNQRKSVLEISKMIGRSANGLVGVLKKYEIYDPHPVNIKTFLPIEELKHLFIDELWPAKRIAEKYNVSTHTILRNLHENGIYRTDELNGKAGQLRSFEKDDYSKEDLYQYYVIEKHSMKEAAEYFGVSVTAIFRRVRAYGFTRSKEETWEMIAETNLKKYGVKNPFESQVFQDKANRTRIEKTGFAHPKYAGMDPETVEMLWDREKLGAYMKDNGFVTTKEVANALGIDFTTVDRALHRLDAWDLIDATRSGQEAEISAFLASIGVETYHDRKVIAPYEIDLYSKEHKIGIEYNGSYFHSEYEKDKNYHKTKSVLAEEKGVFIYHIFDYEWLDPEKRERIEWQLKNLFGKNSRRLYARNCEVREVSSKERIVFLNENHVQGVDKASLAYGLYCNDELVSIMTFGKPRFEKHHDWELIRFCSKRDTSVVGGASKLFKYFLENNEGSVVSYSNVAKTRGTLYETLGFEFERGTVPNYVWVSERNPVNYLTRYQTQMKDEVKIMHEKGYYRVYDCGNKVWVYNR